MSDAAVCLINFDQYHWTSFHQLCIRIVQYKTTNRCDCFDNACAEITFSSSNVHMCENDDVFCIQLYADVALSLLLVLYWRNRRNDCGGYFGRPVTYVHFTNNRVYTFIMSNYCGIRRKHVVYFLVLYCIWYTV